MAEAVANDLNDYALKPTIGNLPSVEPGMKSKNDLPEIERSIKDAIDKLKKTTTVQIHFRLPKHSTRG